MRPSYTAVVERNVDWAGEFATEPYEAAWATEAVFFVRVLHRRGAGGPVAARAQISPDGMVWMDEGQVLTIDSETDLAAVRLTVFGGWLRLVGSLPDGQKLRVIVYLNLK